MRWGTGTVLRLLGTGLLLWLGGTFLLPLCFPFLLGTALAGGWKTLAAVCAVTLPIALHFRQTARKRFGGVSGDLAGWFLVKLEFWLLAALTAVQILEGRG